MSDKKYLIIIGGPTASGKTSLAIRLANYFNTEIISCDSRQFYKELSIGTAKPNEEELKAAKHHFIGHINIHQNYTVGDFEKEALSLTEQLFQKHNVLITVGGSGLYIKALCQGLDYFPDVPTEIRNAIEQRYKSEGLSWLQNALKEADPQYYTEVDLNNPHRLIRALSVCEVADQPYSYYRNRQKSNRNFECIYIQPYWDRATLYDRINRRVDLMLHEGLLEEVTSLFDYKNLKALQTVGYQEIFKYLEHEISLEESVELIKRNTRRYAKRQLTWNRGETHWKHFKPEDWKTCLEFIQWRIDHNLTLEETELEHHDQFKKCRLSMSVSEGQEAAINIYYLKKDVVLQGFQESTKEFINQLLWQETFFRASERSIYYLGDISNLSKYTENNGQWQVAQQFSKSLRFILKNLNKLDIPIWVMS